MNKSVLGLNEIEYKKPFAFDLKTPSSVQHFNSFIDAISRSLQLDNKKEVIEESKLIEMISGLQCPQMKMITLT